jgi:hypothetical protein
MKINIAREFGRFPGGRFIKDGPLSGEAFREFITPRINQALKNGEKIILELDDLAGLPPSFIDAAFGDLVRNRVATVKQLMDILEFKVSLERLTDKPNVILSYIRRADM